jgi:prevent-host-death family protein
MDETQVSMTALRQNLGDLVNRAAYGGERIVLVSHGEPRAAIIGIADLRRLEQAAGTRVSEQRDQFGLALEAADQVRERIRRWQEAQGIEPGNSVEDLRHLREERDDDLLGLR